MENKRKISNFLVDSGAQLRLALAFLALLSTSVGLIIYLFFITSAAFSSDIDTLSPQLLALISETKMKVLMASTIGIALLGALCGILWGLASHRIFGPMVQIHYQLDRFLQGNYSERINLRKKDEFHSIAEKLNQLGDSLAKEK